MINISSVFKFLIFHLFCFLLFPVIVHSQTQIRYQGTMQGGATLIGNSWYYGLPPFDGLPPYLNDKLTADVDGDNSTSMSSSADLILPAGSKIEKVFLSIEGGYDNYARFANVKLKVPGAVAYTNLTSATSLANKLVNLPLGFVQMIWDITSFVPANGYVSTAAGGAGGRFYLADPNPLPTTMGGWSIIVVYSNPNSKFRSITVADNWQYFEESVVETNIIGIKVPSSGNVKAVVGVTGTYGDREYEDFLKFGKQGGVLALLKDPFTGLDNDALNSSIAWAATNNVSADGGPAISGNYAARNPISKEHLYGISESWGFDADIFDASSILTASTTPIDVTLRQESNSADILVSGSYFISVDLALAPKLTKVLSPTSIYSGETATYTWTVTNTLSDAILQTISFTDNLPASIKVAAVANASIVGGTGGSIVATPGSGVVTISNLQLNPGQSATIKVDITNVAGALNASCSGLPSPFTNSAANITLGANVSLDASGIVPQCLIVKCRADVVPPIISGIDFDPQPTTASQLLSGLTISNLPANTVLTLHTGATATNANKLGPASPLSAGTTYYIAFWDSVNNCYSPTTAIPDCPLINHSPFIYHLYDEFTANINDTQQLYKQMYYGQLPFICPTGTGCPQNNANQPYAATNITGTISNLAYGDSKYYVINQDGDLMITSNIIEGKFVNIGNAQVNSTYVNLAYDKGVFYRWDRVGTTNAVRLYSSTDPVNLGWTLMGNMSLSFSYTEGSGANLRTYQMADMAANDGVFYFMYVTNNVSQDGTGNANRTRTFSSTTPLTTPSGSWTTLGTSYFGYGVTNIAFGGEDIFAACNIPVCPSGALAPNLANTTFNPAPGTVANLIALLSASNKPLNTQFSIHTASPATYNNRMAPNAALLPNTTYYVAFWNQEFECYSPTTAVALGAAPCTGPDSDGDGVPDMCDLDDDNDGILDTDECITTNVFANLTPATITNPSGVTATVIGIDFGGVNNGKLTRVHNGTSTASGLQLRKVTSNLSNATVYTPVGTSNQAVFAEAIQGYNNNTNYVRYTLTLDKPVQSVTLHIDGFDFMRTRFVGAHKEQLVSGGTQLVYDPSLRIMYDSSPGSTGSITRDGYGSLKITSTDGSPISQISYEKYDDPNVVDPQDGTSYTFSIVPACDFDEDGVPNNLDLDSDNDGCPDAIEGDENVTNSQLATAGGTVTVGFGSTASNQNLGNTVDVNGVPTIVNAGGSADIGSDSGQGLGSSQNSAINVCPAFCTEPPATGAAASFAKIGISDREKITAGWPGNVPNAFIALESQNKGFVITRVSSSAAIADPKEGMLIYDMAANCVKLFNGASWKCLAKACY